MKRKVIIIIAAVCLALVCGGVLFHNIRKSDSALGDDELLLLSRKGYNSVEIYEQKNKLTIIAKSKAEFFDDTQFTLETSGEITPADVEIIWMTIDGRPELELLEDEDLVIAELKIRENGSLICDKKINFVKKATDAIEDVLKQTTK